MNESKYTMWFQVNMVLAQLFVSVDYSVVRLFGISFTLFQVNVDVEFLTPALI